MTDLMWAASGSQMRHIFIWMQSLINKTRDFGISKIFICVMRKHCIPLKLLHGLWYVPEALSALFRTRNDNYLTLHYNFGTICQHSTSVIPILLKHCKTWCQISLFVYTTTLFPTVNILKKCIVIEKTSSLYSSFRLLSEKEISAQSAICWRFSLLNILNFCTLFLQFCQ